MPKPETSIATEPGSGTEAGELKEKDKLLGKETVCPEASESARDPVIKVDPIGGTVELMIVVLKAPGPKVKALVPTNVVTVPESIADPFTVPSIVTMKGLGVVKPVKPMLKSRTRPEQPGMTVIAAVID